MLFVSVSIDFLPNPKGDSPFHYIGCGYFHTDWEVLHTLMRNVPSGDIFKFGVSTGASEFSDWVEVGIYVCIPHCKYQVKSHSSPCFSATCATAMGYRNQYFRLY